MNTTMLSKILRNELYQSKKNEMYLTAYINFIKSCKKWVEITSLLLSTSGIAAWFSTKNAQWAALTSSMSVGVKLSELFFEKMIANEDHVQDLVELKNSWLTYFYETEKIWLKWHSAQLTEAEVLQLYSDKLIGMRSKLEERNSAMKIWKVYHLTKQSDAQSVRAMDQYFTY